MAYPKKATICIVGAGAIGGLLGVALSQCGHTVTFLARGGHLAAMQQKQALEITRPDGTTQQSAPGSKFVGSLQSVGVQDIVILGLKMHQIQAILADLPGIVGDNTVLMTTQNGLPWWYFQEYNGPAKFKGRTVESVDPGGLLKSSIDASKIIASVVYPAAHISSPGVIRHTEGTRFPIGEPCGKTTPRVTWLSQILIEAGFKCPILSDVRAEVWLKLWGTVAINPLCALTHATLDVLCAEPPGRDLVLRVMREVEQVANALGAHMRLPAERRVDGAARVGRHRTSMLQDVENGRTMEIDTIIGSVVELARLCEVNTPCVDTIHATINLLQIVMNKEKAKLCLLAKQE